MFGTKEQKRERLFQLVEMVQAHPGISQAKLARVLGVNRSTILRDLAELEEMGIRLWEDAGRLYLAE